MKDGEAAPKKSSTALEKSSREERAREVRVTAAGGLGIRMCSSPDEGWASMSHSLEALEALKRAGMRKVEEVELRADIIVSDVVWGERRRGGAADESKRTGAGEEVTAAGERKYIPRP